MASTGCVPVVLCLAVAFPAAFAGGRLCCIGHDGALVDDLHTGTAVFSGPPATAGRQTGNEGLKLLGLFTSFHRAASSNISHFVHTSHQTLNSVNHLFNPDENDLFVRSECYVLLPVVFVGKLHSQKI